MTTTKTTAGKVTSTRRGWEWACSFCDVEGTAARRDGAIANIGNHLLHDHVTVIA